jgi:cobalt-zinc-cadmium efflux system protein
MACSHDHTPTLSPAAITFAIVLNALFVIAQVYYGLASHSLSLLADAGHNFGDLLGIILAGVAIWASALRPTRTYTYGLKSATILAALANSLLLILTVIELVHASVDRFLSSELANPIRPL